MTLSLRFALELGFVDAVLKLETLEFEAHTSLFFRASFLGGVDIRVSGHFARKFSKVPPESGGHVHDVTCFKG